MQITVEIPDELAAQVEARGLTPEGFVRDLIDKAARTVPLPLPPAKPRMDMDEFFKAMSAYSDRVPHVPDEALTRTAMYQDHD